MGIIVIGVIIYLMYIVAVAMAGSLSDFIYYSTHRDEEGGNWDDFK